MAELIAEGSIKGLCGGIFSFWSKQPHEGIPLEVVIFVVAALHGNETASAANALELEAQTRFLVSRIIFDTISFLSLDLVGVFEYTHTLRAPRKQGYVDLI